MPGIFDPGIFDPGIFDVSSEVITVIPPIIVTVTIPEVTPPQLANVTTVVPPIIVTATIPTPVMGQFAAIPPIEVRAILPTPYVTQAGAGIREGPVRLFIGYIEILDMAIDWGIETEEVLGGVSTASAVIYDTSGDFDPEPHEDVLITIRATGWKLFHGELLTPKFLIQPGTTMVTWTLPMSGFKLSDRLLGAPDGGNFWRPNDTVPYENIDPSAISYGTDQFTVQQWMRSYFAFPNGTTADTGSYVFEYVPNSFLGSAENIMWLYTAMTNLQHALEQLAAAAEDVNVQFGLWADDKMYWLGIPDWRDMTTGGSSGDLPAAPVDFGVGGTAIRLRMEGEKDGSAMPEFLFAQGATPAAVLGDDGVPVAGGSGWYPFTPASNRVNHRQAYLAIPQSWTDETKIRLAEFAYRRAQFSTLRANVQIIEENMGGFRPGMVGTFVDPRLPASLQDDNDTLIAVIQRVHTTFLPGTETFQTDMDIGDGPAQRIGFASHDRDRTEVIKYGINAPWPLITWTVRWDNYGSIGIGEHRAFTATARNSKDEPWAVPNVPVTFELIVTDHDGNVITVSDAFTDPVDTTTDQDGKARGVLNSDTGLAGTAIPGVPPTRYYYTIKVKMPVTAFVAP